MRTEITARIAEPTRASALNSYRKNSSPSPTEATKKGDTVELSAEAKKLSSQNMEQELQSAIVDKVRNLKASFSQGNFQVTGSMIDQIADRMLAII